MRSNTQEVLKINRSATMRAIGTPKNNSEGERFDQAEVNKPKPYNGAAIITINGHMNKVSTNTPVRASQVLIVGTANSTDMAENKRADAKTENCTNNTTIK